MKDTLMSGFYFLSSEYEELVIDHRYPLQELEVVFKGIC